jgi:hypothetical protein
MGHEFDSLKAEPKRDRYGRPLIIPPTGGKAVAYTRPTTIADTLDDRHNLELWMQRQVALGLADRPDLVARIATTDPTDKSTLNGICSDARDAAGSSAAANMGTAIHAAVEAANRGEQPPEMFAEIVGRYQATLADHGITVDPDHVEQFCVNEPIKAAGTFDMIVTVDGKTYIADLKTGSSVQWSGRSFAIQLAIYATATSYYDVATETHTLPVTVERDTALIVHLPAQGDTCTLHWLNIGAGLEALDRALWVRKWRRRDDLLIEVPMPEPEAKPKARKPKRTLEATEMPPVPEAHTEKAERKRVATVAKIAADAADEVPVKASWDDDLTPLVSLELVKELRDRALASDGAETIRRWVDESRAAERDFSMGKGLHTERRYTISAAAVNLAEGGDDDEWARAVIAVVLGDDAHKPTVTVGGLLGSLDQEQAVRIDELARTAKAFYDDDGRLIVEESS